MRKPVTILLAMVILIMTTAAVAEVDISELSFDELVALKDKINLAIWNSKEWEEITVPQGEWIVGEDVPAGKWTIKCADVDRHDYMMKECDIMWGFSENGHINTNSEAGGGSVNLYNPHHEEYATGELTEITVELKDGMVFIINTYCAPALFTPYAGKPSLGF